jgi:hypothetical protein
VRQNSPLGYLLIGNALPPLPRPTGIMELAGNTAQNLGLQSLRGKILSHKHLCDVRRLKNQGLHNRMERVRGLSQEDTTGKLCGFPIPGQIEVATQTESPAARYTWAAGRMKASVPTRTGQLHAELQELPRHRYSPALIGVPSKYSSMVRRAG